MQPVPSSSLPILHLSLFSCRAALPCLDICLGPRHAILLPITMAPTSPRRESPDSTADPFFEDSHTLNHSESQENATRLMDDLELLRAERMASNDDRDSRSRSKSLHRSRHNPEPAPEDAFDTLTSQPQIPQTKPDKKPTVVARIFKDLKRFPRVFRYFVYVCTLRISIFAQSNHQSRQYRWLLYY